MKLEAASVNRAALSHDLDLGPYENAPVNWTLNQRFRVMGALVVVMSPQSWIERLACKFPGARRLFAQLHKKRDAVVRAWATAQVEIDHVAVGLYEEGLENVTKLPAAPAGTRISVSVNNRANRPLVARVLIMGELSCAMAP